MLAQKLKALPHFTPKPLELGFGRDNIGPEFLRSNDDVPSLAHREVAEKRDHVSRYVQYQNSTESDVVVNKSHNRSRDQESSLYAREQECVRLHELAFRGEFLNERGDCGPEHPEPSSYQSVHQIKLPNLYPVPEREDGHREDNHSAYRVEPHHQASTVFTVDHHSREGKHEHGGKGLQNGKRAQRHLGMCGLKDIPGNGSRIHPTTHHRHEVGGEDETQRAITET